MAIWTEIKKALNTNLDKPLNSLITDYGNVTNAIKQDTYNLITRGSIKSIQRGEGNGEKVKDVYFSSVNLSKSLIVLNSSYPSAGNTSGISLRSLTNTSMRLNFGGTTNTSCYFNWQVIEFY